MSATRWVRPVTASEFDSVLAAAPTPVVVDFWAAWCGPCRRLAPVYERLSEEFNGRVTFLSVNVDAEPTLATRFSILSIPTIKVFREGKDVATQFGVDSADTLRAVLNEWADAGQVVGLASAERR